MDIVSVAYAPLTEGSDEISSPIADMTGVKTVAGTLTDSSSYPAEKDVHLMLLTVTPASGFLTFYKATEYDIAFGS